MKLTVALLLGCLLQGGVAMASDLPKIEVMAGAIRPEVAAELQKDLPGVVTFDRVGPDSSQVLAALESATGPSPAKIVLLNCGCPDMRHDSPDLYERNLRAIVGLLRQRRQIVLWSNSPPWTDSSDADADVDASNKIAAKVMADAKVITFDFHGFCLSLQPKGAKPPAPDGKLWKKEADFFAEGLGQWWAVCARENPNAERTPLWPGTPPAYQDVGPECINNRGRVQSVSIPEITRFNPTAQCNGTALIVFPGGGYAFMGYLRNAQELSAELSPKGIAVFGLKYRTGRGWEPPLLDAQRAVRWVRAHASEWGIDPNRIGVAGISAGANLALRLSGSFTAGDPAAADPVERQGSRPDFVAVFSSWNNGTWDSPFVFHRDTPPIFLRHARDDKGFPLAEKVVSQIQAAGVPLNFLYLDKGGHGAFDITPDGAGRNWPDDFLPWLRQLGLLKNDGAKTNP